MTTAVRTGTPESGAKGLSFLVIPLRLPGVRIRRLQTSGLNASGSALVTLDDVHVPANNLIGKPGSGFSMIMANFNNERSNLAINALALARMCADDAKAHAFRRKTFGRPLVENQLIRAKLASMERGIESTHAWLEQLTYEVQVNPQALHDPTLGAKFALLKVQAGRVSLVTLPFIPVSNGLFRFWSIAVERLSRFLAGKSNTSSYLAYN